MANITTRSSVLAIMKETTEGVPVIPSAATSFVALQDNFSMTPSFTTLTNAELRSSIGETKPIQGLEAPKASLSHYLRASGVIGQAPNFGPVLEAAFGATSVASTEYPTVSASTTSVIKVGSGNGAHFERGQALLIKDPTNGYRIRCVDSVATDNLTLGFNVPVAPGSGVNLGKAVLYKPANAGHPTLTLWHYLGNGGAVEMTAGMRVVSTAIDITAGDLIDIAFGLEGLAFYWNPVNILAADIYLDFTDDSGVGHAAVVAVGFYKDPYDLASAIQNAMNAVSSGYSVTYLDATGKYSIVGTGTLLSLLFSSGTNAANSICDKIGFTATDHTGTAATTGYVSDTAVVLSAPYMPTYDNSDPLAAKDNEIMVGTSTDYACFNASKVSFELDDTKTDILSVCSTTGKSGSIISGRKVKGKVSALLSQYQVEKFKNFRSNDEIKMQYSFGIKSGGNWVPSKCGVIYMSNAVVSSFAISDNNGLAQLDLELTGFVDSNGDGEAYINFL